MVNIGEAYAFLYYKDGIEDISKQLPVVRDMALTPSNLKLYLRTFDNSTIAKDHALADIIQQANKDKIEGDRDKQGKLVDMNYVLKAIQPNATNETVAIELGAILTGNNGILYEEGEYFFKKIAYKEGDKYVFR